jgi:hypothetical protein
VQYATGAATTGSGSGAGSSTAALVSSRGETSTCAHASRRTRSGLVALNASRGRQNDSAQPARPDDNRRTASPSTNVSAKPLS